MNERIEKILAASPGPRVTEVDMQKRIAFVHYDYLPHAPTTTICSIVLDNGYSVRGESACVDPANFNVEAGKHYALKSAFNKLWPLFGFLLAERLHQEKSA